MLKEMKKHVNNEKGLTLIELLAVIVILAIIAAIAIPAIGNIINNSRDKAILSESLNILSGAKIAHMDGECKATANTCTATEIQPYVDGVDVTGVTVVLDGSDWKITFPKFTNIKSDKYKPGDGGGGPYTETEIKETLDPQ